MLNPNEVKQYLPHRYPFLLVDKVITYTLGESIHAIKNVTYNEPYFVGHFPAQAVMPGVLMLEALAQAAGVLMAKTLNWPPDHENLFFLAGIDNARFKRVVSPGDQLHLEIKVLKARRDLWKIEGRASVDGELACQAEIMMIRGTENRE